MKINSKTRQWGGTILTVLAAALTVFAAAPPGQINYQGVLRDAAGNPQTGTLNMTFRFFDNSAGGSEILVDTHSGASAIGVSGGLFDVALGSGTVTDGSAVLPGDPYTTLGQVFRDFTNVWLQISIGAETLTPRVQILSAAYALNSANLNGQPAGSYLDTSATAQSKLAALTLGGLSLRSTDMRLNAGGAESSQQIYFREDGSDQGEQLAWDDALDTFSLSDQLDVSGRLRLRDQFFASIDFSDGVDDAACRVSYDTADTALEISRRVQIGGTIMVGNTTNLPPPYNRFGAAGSPDSGDMSADGDIYVESDVEVDGALYLSGTLRMKDQGPDADQSVYFYDDGVAANESLRWSDSADRFEFSNALATAGPLRIGNINGGEVAYNHFGAAGTSADAEQITGIGDVYIADDLEVDQDVLLSGNLFMKHSGTDSNQYLWFFDGGRVDDEWISWDDASDRFEVSDSLHVFGDLTANLKNFVQNHPTREDLEVVFTSLEGDEVTVFTRGSARLKDGVARVALGPAFALVANPSYGLSAHLTPRGDWSELYVAAISPTELEVRAHGGSSDAVFDYVVYALRAGYENFPTVRPRRAEAPLPATGSFDADSSAAPEAAASTAAARYVAMHRSAFGAEPEQSGLNALTQAIGREVEEVRASQPRVVSATKQPIAPATSRPAEPQAVTATSSESDVIRARAFHAQASASAGLENASGVIEPGDVLVIDGDTSGAVRRADRANDPRVVGIAVVEGGLTLGSNRTADSASSAGQVAIAMSGVVLCKVDAAFGTIEPGDLLVSSPNPGFAMKAHDPEPGTVVGKALQRAEQGQSSIRVLVMQR